MALTTSFVFPKSVRACPSPTGIPQRKWSPSNLSPELNGTSTFYERATSGRQGSLSPGQESVGSNASSDRTAKPPVTMKPRGVLREKTSNRFQVVSMKDTAKKRLSVALAVPKKESILQNARQRLKPKTESLSPPSKDPTPIVKSARPRKHTSSLSASSPIVERNMNLPQPASSPRKHAPSFSTSSILSTRQTQHSRKLSEATTDYTCSLRHVPSSSSGAAKSQPRHTVSVSSGRMLQQLHEEKHYSNLPSRSLRSIPESFRPSLSSIPSSRSFQLRSTFDDSAYAFDSSASSTFDDSGFTLVANELSMDKESYRTSTTDVSTSNGESSPLSHLRSFSVKESPHLQAADPRNEPSHSRSSTSARESPPRRQAPIAPSPTHSRSFSAKDAQPGAYRRRPPRSPSLGQIFMTSTPPPAPSARRMTTDLSSSSRNHMRVRSVGSGCDPAKRQAIYESIYESASSEQEVEVSGPGSILDLYTTSGLPHSRSDSRLSLLSLSSTTPLRSRSRAGSLESSSAGEGFRVLVRPPSGASMLYPQPSFEVGMLLVPSDDETGGGGGGWYHPIVEQLMRDIDVAVREWNVVF